MRRAVEVEKVPVVLRDASRALYSELRERARVRRAGGRSSEELLEAASCR
jgi:hypothetical protein